MNTLPNTLLHHLHSLAATQANGALPDRQLLEMFLAQRSEASFAALVRRHGPMVWSVCRRVLRNHHDAEDVFQAVFLIFARKAAHIRKRESVSGFLHGVAYHIAAKLKLSSARRAARERTQARPSFDDPCDDLTWRELRSVLDEELAQLPQQQRAPLVLCYLEGKTQDEAARLLGWSKSTIRRRLEQGRNALGRRLMRRDVTLSAALSVPLLAGAGAQAALPPLLAASTVRAGMAATTGQALAPLVSAQVAALIEGGTCALLAKKASIALALLVMLTLSVGGLLAHRALHNRTAAEVPAAAKTAPSAPLQPARSASKEAGIEIKGRVLDPDGKPLAGARLLLSPKDNPKKADKSIRATTDKDGRFRFMARSVDFGPQGKGVLAATAKGFGPDWIDVKAGEKREEITLRLVADDVPLVGRVLDLEGRPIAGVSVRVLRVGKVPRGADLKPWLDKNIEMRRQGTYLNDNELSVIRADLLDLVASARTGADGTVRLSGFGRDRVVRLDIEGPDIVWRKMWAVTRPGPARGFIPGFWGVYAARFDYVAAPCKPIIGTVREKGSGKPLAGITVGSAMHGDIETTTDKNGRYRLIGVAKNPRYAIVAEGTYYFNCTKHDIADTSALEPITVDFELERGIPIRGRLTNKATGEPVRGSVFYCALADNPHLKGFKELGSFQQVHLGNPFDTAADGSFTALGIPGPGLLCVRADNGAFIEAKPVDARGAPWKSVPNIVLTGYHALVPVKVSESDPKTQVCDIVLDPGRSVKGTVFGPDSKPLTGVRILGLTSTPTDSGGQARKDADFTVLALEAGRERTLIFCHEEKQLGKVLQVRGDDKGPLMVQLEPLGILTGRMVDAAGRPLAGLTVRVRQAHSAFDRKTTTDRDGKFRVENLLPGRKFLLAIANGDPWKSRSMPVYFDDGMSVESGATKDVGDLKPKPPRRK